MLAELNLFGLNVNMYNLFNVLGFFVLFIFNYYQGGKVFLGYKNDVSIINPKTQKPNFVTNHFLGIFVLSCVQFFSGVLMNVLLGNLFNGGTDNYFGFAIFAPFIFILFCKIVKTDPIGYLDAFTPAYALSLVSFKIGCFCAGCCQGADMVFSLYYPNVDMHQFPIQALECAVAFGIFLFLLYYRKKAHRGTMHAMYLILYSSTRFCTEFLRAEENIFFVFKAYHIWCLIGIAAGIAEFIIMEKRYAVS